MDSIKLFMSINFSALTVLYFGSNAIGTKGINLLIKVDLPNLKWLGIGTYYKIADNCEISDGGFRNIIKSKWNKLSTLTLGIMMLIKIIIK